VTVAEASDSLRRRIEIEGASTSWLKTLESMQGTHLVPRFGDKPMDMTRACLSRPVFRFSRGAAA
jgi:hypothetical protein